MAAFLEDFERALAELLPAMEPDGGGAEVVSIEGRSAVLRLVGSCLFCPSRALSAAALEKGLRSRVPGIENVRIL
jgi:Fe-S cluster biogenesis protein NfuA